MAERNAVQLAVDEFARAAGMSKRSGSWYLIGTEVTAVVDLQKSQYSPSYYLNIGYWLPALGDQRFPKEPDCHIRIRLDLLIRDAEAEVKELLDLESNVPIAERQQRIQNLLTSQLLPILKQGLSLEGVRQLRGRGLLKSAAIRGSAVPLLNRD